MGGGHLREPPLPPKPPPTRPTSFNADVGWPQPRVASLWADTTSGSPFQAALSSPTASVAWVWVSGALAPHLARAGGGVSCDPPPNTRLTGSERERGTDFLSPAHPANPSPQNTLSRDVSFSHHPVRSTSGNVSTVVPPPFHVGNENHAPNPRPFFARRGSVLADRKASTNRDCQ